MELHDWPWCSQSNFQVWCTSVLPWFSNTMSVILQVTKYIYSRCPKVEHVDEYLSWFHSLYFEDCVLVVKNASVKYLHAVPFCISTKFYDRELVGGSRKILYHCHLWAYRCPSTAICRNRANVKVDNLVGGIGFTFFIICVCAPGHNELNSDSYPNNRFRGKHPISLLYILCIWTQI